MSHPVGNVGLHSRRVCATSMLLQLHRNATFDLRGARSYLAAAWSRHQSTLKSNFHWDDINFFTYMHWIDRGLEFIWAEYIKHRHRQHFLNSCNQRNSTENIIWIEWKMIETDHVQFLGNSSGEIGWKKEFHLGKWTYFQ